MKAVLCLLLLACTEIVLANRSHVMGGSWRVFGKRSRLHALKLQGHGLNEKRFMGFDNDQVGVEEGKRTGTIDWARMLSKGKRSGPAKRYIALCEFFGGTYCLDQHKRPWLDNQEMVHFGKRGLGEDNGDFFHFGKRMGQGDGDFFHFGKRMGGDGDFFHFGKRMADDGDFFHFGKRAVPETEADSDFFHFGK